MNYKKLKVLFICAIIFYSYVDAGKGSSEIWTKEILKAEHNFARVAKDKG